MNNTVIKTGSAQTEFKKPTIEEGFYYAKVTAVKTETKDGKPFQKDYAATKDKPANSSVQAVVELQLFEMAPDKTVGPALQSDGNDVIMGNFITIAYVQGGVSRSAFGAATKSTKFLENFGWKWTPEVELDLASFIGQWCRVVVKDYTNKATPPQTFSVIDSVLPFKKEVVASAVPTTANVPPVAAPTTPLTKITREEYDIRAHNATALFESGDIDKATYGRMMEQLTQRLD